jgi:hypothetical protein
LMDVSFIPSREFGEEIELNDGNPPPNNMKYVNRRRHVIVHESAATIIEVRRDLLPLRAPRLLPIPPERAVAPSIRPSTQKSFVVRIIFMWLK